MQIYAHRGFWNGEFTLQNSKLAIKKAFELGLGVEIDLWKVLDEIYITHDGDSREFAFYEFMDIWSTFSDMPVAFNIKTDGIANKISDEFKDFGSSNFFFDMSFPESIKFIEADLPIAVRVSELEPLSLKKKNNQLYWMDSFYSEWWLQNFNDVSNIFEKSIIVSPELHGRAHMQAWNFIQDNRPYGICTDYPLEFLDFHK